MGLDMNECGSKSLLDNMEYEYVVCSISTPQKTARTNSMIEVQHILLQ
jgi:hypothetical protein